MILAMYVRSKTEKSRFRFHGLPFNPWAEASCSRGGSFYGHFLLSGFGWHGEALGLEVYAGSVDGKDGKDEGGKLVTTSGGCLYKY